MIRVTPHPRNRHMTPVNAHEQRRGESQVLYRFSLQFRETLLLVIPR
jgi:hypothetical protein